MIKAEQLSKACFADHTALGSQRSLQLACRGSTCSELAKLQAVARSNLLRRKPSRTARSRTAAAADADVIDVEAEEIDNRIPVTVGCAPDLEGYLASYPELT